MIFINFREHLKRKILLIFIMKIRVISPVCPPQKLKDFKRVKSILKDFPKTFFSRFTQSVPYSILEGD